jgi:hypothetical protein
MPKPCLLERPNFPPRMARTLLPALASLLSCAICFLSREATAQVFGQLSPAVVLQSGERTLGAYGLFTDRSWGGLGMARAGIGHDIDGGLELGFASHEDTPELDQPNTILFGADGRYQIRRATPDAPVDACLGLALGFESGSGFTRWAFAPQALASHRIVYDDNGHAVTPYGSLSVEYESLSVPGSDGSDLNMRARIGGMWEPSPRLGLTAELGFGGEVVFAAGARWPF